MNETNPTTQPSPTPSAATTTPTNSPTIADIVDSDSDDEEKNYECDKEGYLHLKKKKKMTKHKIFWFTLTGSSLYYYKHPNNHEPKGVIQIHNAEVFDVDPTEKDKKFAFYLKTPADGQDYSLLADTDEDFAQWLAVLKKAITAAPATAPNKQDLKEKSSSLMFKTKKHISGKIATSSIIGKGAMKRILPEEVTEILNILDLLITKKYSAERAKEVNKIITRTLIKGYFQIEKKNLDLDQVLVCYKPLREAFELIVKIHDNYVRWKKLNPNQLNLYFQRIESLMKKVEELVTKLLSPYLKAENIIKLKQTFDLVGSAKFWAEIWSDDSLREGEEIIDFCIALNKFSSFHVHKPRNRAHTSRF